MSSIKAWTDEEVKFLKENYAEKGPSYIGKQLNRSAESIRRKIKKINGDEIHKFRNIRNWTDEEINYLKENYTKLTITEIAKKLDRTRYSITYMSKRIFDKETLNKNKNNQFYKKYGTPRKVKGFIYYSSTRPYKKEKGIKLKLKLIEEKGGGCQLCGYDKNLTALVFHHRNPDEKLFSLDMSHLYFYSNKRVLEEAAKCDLLCQNCHHELHHPEYDKNNINKNI